MGGFKMKTTTVTVEEMEKRIIRFNKLESYQDQQHRATGVPVAVLEKLAARRVYPMMVPENYAGRSSLAPMRGAPGLALTIAECPPGDGPGLHVHERTVENFFCLDGKFRISWGDNGERSITLDKHDMVSVPPGISRRFENISNEIGRLLVMIQIPEGEQTDNVAYAPSVGEEVEKEFGKATVDKLNSIGFKFDAEAATS
jgi:mannose-6-phosphate isomerase-like protein (cupin superfamily)